MHLYLPGCTLIYQNISTVSTFLMRFTIIYMGLSIISLIEQDLPGFTVVYRDLPPHLHGLMPASHCPEMVARWLHEV